MWRKKASEFWGKSPHCGQCRRGGNRTHADGFGDRRTTIIRRARAIQLKYQLLEYNIENSLKNQETDFRRPLFLLGFFVIYVMTTVFTKL